MNNGKRDSQRRLIIVVHLVTELHPHLTSFWTLMDWKKCVKVCIVCDISHDFSCKIQKKKSDLPPNKDVNVHSLDRVLYCMPPYSYLKKRSYSYTYCPKNKISVCPHTLRHLAHTDISNLHYYQKTINNIKIQLKIDQSFSNLLIKYYK